MAKSSLEKQLEKQMRQQKQLADRQRRDEQQSERKRNEEARKQANRERAATLINGQPIINGFRIMDATSEEVLKHLLSCDKSKNNQISYDNHIFPEYLHASMGLELEKLIQYGMISVNISYFNGGILSLLPPALTYFEDKETALASKGVVNMADLSEKKSNKVFIVHGHDDETKLQVARALEKAKFEAIILHEQADDGLTIIEKLEKNTDVGYAVVIYTECDIGRAKEEKIENEHYRARQNVVFEHGYLIGKLGRGNVCAIVKGEVETPGDISGVIYIPFDSPGAWKQRMFNNMRAAGLDVDMNLAL